MLGDMTHFYFCSLSCCGVMFVLLNIMKMANLKVLVFDILVMCNSDLCIYCVVLMKLNQNTAKLKD